MTVQLKAVLEDEFVLHLSRVHSIELIAGPKLPEDLLLDPDEIAMGIRGFHFQPLHFPKIFDGGHPLGMVDLQERRDETPLHGRSSLRVEKGDLQQIILFQNFLGDSQTFRTKAYGGDSPSLSIPPVVHLPGGLDDVPAAYRDGTGKARNPAASLLLRLPKGRIGKPLDQLSPGRKDFLDILPPCLHV
jgi:hypothetical protein